MCCKDLDVADAADGIEGPYGEAPVASRQPPQQVSKFAERGGRNPPKLESVIQSMQNPIRDADYGDSLLNS